VKQAIGIALVMLALIVGYSVLTMPEEQAVQEQASPFAFKFNVNSYGILDSGDDARGFITARVLSQSAENATMEVMLFGNDTMKSIHMVDDYPYGNDKKEAISAMEGELLDYNIRLRKGHLDDLMDREGSVMVIPSDAMPDRLSSGELVELIEGNVVIFFGKPLDVSLDWSGSQTFIGDTLFSELEVTDDGKELTAKSQGPAIHQYGNATVLAYENGWLVIYEEEMLQDPASFGKEMASLVLREGWQEDRAESSYSIGEMDGAKTFYSTPAEVGDHNMRVLYSAHSVNGSETGMFEMGEVQMLDGRLMMKERSVSGEKISYAFELHDNLTYPVKYDFTLRFMKDGEEVDSVQGRSVTMKTFARDSGSVVPNLTAGSYNVMMKDQNGKVHAMAYTHIPDLDVSLVRISDNAHFFDVTRDGEPAVLEEVELLVNDKDSFTLHTDKEGEASVSFMLGPGTHSFTIKAEGESATTYYRKADTGGSMMLYTGLVLGSVVMLGAIAVRSKRKRKWAVKTYRRPSTASRTLKVPYETFLELFRMTQDGRAKGLPLSVYDLRLGLRKHATYKGAPLFVTDSNLYTLLDGMVKDGRFLSYGGYFLPKEMADGKPVEYWIIRRRLTDYFIEHGEELDGSKDADFLVRGKMVHIWQDLDAKKLVSLCRKADNVIIFPDSGSREGFRKRLQRHGADWMRLSLELQYGRLHCETLDEFLERGFRGKV
jgi:hypothetical protein